MGSSECKELGVFHLGLWLTSCVTFMGPDLVWIIRLTLPKIILNYRGHSGRRLALISLTIDERCPREKKKSQLCKGKIIFPLTISGNIDGTHWDTPLTLEPAVRILGKLIEAGEGWEFFFFFKICIWSSQPRDKGKISHYPFLSQWRLWVLVLGYSLIVDLPLPETAIVFLFVSLHVLGIGLTLCLLGAHWLSVFTSPGISTIMLETLKYDRIETWVAPIFS